MGEFNYIEVCSEDESILKSSKAANRLVVIRMIGAFLLTVLISMASLGVILGLVAWAMGTKELSLSKVILEVASIVYFYWLTGKIYPKHEDEEQKN